LKGQALVFKREQLGSSRANGGVFEANRHYFRAEQNSSHQAASDQSCKQVWHAFADIRTFHDAAKLLARRGAAIEFHPEHSCAVVKRFGRQRWTLAAIPALAFWF
jgi:hypothetical protein